MLFNIKFVVWCC